MLEYAKGSGGQDSGAMGRNVLTLVDEVTITVESIEFMTVAQVFYKVVPDNPTTAPYVRRGTEGEAFHASAPQARPDTNQPHWLPFKNLSEPGANRPPQLDTSWPAVFCVASGTTTTTTTTAPVARLRARFKAVSSTDGSNFSGARWVRATGDLPQTAPVGAGPVLVQFNTTGDGTAVFDLVNVPTVVCRLSDLKLRWEAANPLDSVYRPLATVSRHTLYFVLRAPLPSCTAMLLEVFDWACTWAHGQSTEDGVLGALWSHFSPAVTGRDHDTGFVYWLTKTPAQDITSAIYNIYLSSKHLAQQSTQTQPTTTTTTGNATLGFSVSYTQVERGASCTVFAHVLCACLSAHGIASAEVQAKPFWNGTPSPYTDTFTVGNDVWIKPATWAPNPALTGQGQTPVPVSAQTEDCWASHWLVVVRTQGQYHLLDTSYGTSFQLPTTFDTRANAMFVLPQAYEQQMVQGYRTRKQFTPLDATFLVPSRNPLDPCLTGKILFSTF